MDEKLDHRLQLVPPGAQPRLLMFALCVPIPWLVAAGCLSWIIHNEGLMKTIGSSMMSTFGLGVAGILALTLPAWIVLDRAMRKHRLQISADRLEVKSSFHSESVPLTELQLDQARVIDLHERGDLTPAGKSNGCAIAGFRGGHFHLRNGGKAFVAIAGEHRALWLPTTPGNGLLLQPRQPDALLRHLRELAGTSTHR